jgi:hypothetical protein
MRFKVGRGPPMEKVVLLCVIIRNIGVLAERSPVLRKMRSFLKNEIFLEEGPREVKNGGNCGKFPRLVQALGSV